MLREALTIGLFSSENVRISSHSKRTSFCSNALSSQIWWQRCKKCLAQANSLHRPIKARQFLLSPSNVVKQILRARQFRVFLIASPERFVCPCKRTLFSLTFFPPPSSRRLLLSFHCAMTQNEKSEIFLSTWIIDDCKLLCQFGRYFRWCEFYTRRTLKAAIEPKSSPALHSCGWRVFAWTFVCIDLDLVAIVDANGEWNGGEEEAAVFAENVKNAFRLGETLSHSFLLWNACRSPFLPIENHYSTVGESCMRRILRFRFVIQPSGCLTVFPQNFSLFEAEGIVIRIWSYRAGD